MPAPADLASPDSLALLREVRVFGSFFFSCRGHVYSLHYLYTILLEDIWTLSPLFYLQIHVHAYTAPTLSLGGIMIFTLRTLLLAGTTTVTRRYAPTQLASVALSALGDLEE
jgi:hypothetical protein